MNQYPCAFILTKSDPDKHEAIAGFDHPEGAYGSRFPVHELDLERLGSSVDPVDPTSGDDGKVLDPPESLLVLVESRMQNRRPKGEDPDAVLGAKRLTRLEAGLTAWGPAPVAYDEQRGHARQAAHLAFSWGTSLDSTRELFARLGLPTDPVEDVYSTGSVFVEWASNDAEILAEEKRLADEAREAERLAAEAELREQEEARIVEKMVCDLPQHVDAVFIQLDAYTHKAPVGLDLVSGYGPEYPMVTTRHGVFPGLLVNALELSVPQGCEAGSPEIGWVLVSPSDASVRGTVRKLHALKTSHASMNPRLLEAIRKTRPAVDRSPLTSFKTGTDPSTAANEAAFERCARELVKFAMQTFGYNAEGADPKEFARRMLASEARARFLHPSRAVPLVTRVCSEEWLARGEMAKVSRVVTSTNGQVRYSRPISVQAFEEVAVSLPVEWQSEALFELFGRVYRGEGAELSAGERWEDAPSHVVNRELAKVPEVDPWRDPISSFCAGKNRFVMRELEGELRSLGVLGETTQPSERPRVFRILLSLGWTRKQKMSEGKRVWHWVRTTQ